MKRLIALIAAAAVIPAAAHASPADIAAAKPAIEHANSDWLPAMQAKDADRIVASYSEDGVFVLPDGRSIVGRKAIADLYRQRFAAGGRVLSGEIKSEGLSEAPGGLIVECGHGGSTRVDAGGKQTATGGPYVTVWKKGADGRWAIVRNLVF